LNAEVVVFAVFAVIALAGGWFTWGALSVLH